MRMFELFLRRAGVQAPAAPVRRTLSRLTVVCPVGDMAAVRRHIYSDFKAAGLKVATLQVDRGHDSGLASACVTVDCPPEQRSLLMNRARSLRGHPSVKDVRWGDQRHLALN